MNLLKALRIKPVSYTHLDVYKRQASGDAKSITKAQGIGKKTAERVVLELKDKIGAVATEAVSSAVSRCV